MTSPAGDGSNPSGAKHIWYQMPPKKICKLDYLKLTIKGRFQWAYLKNDSRLSIVFKWRDEIIHLKRLIKGCIASGHPLSRYSLCELGQNRTILINLLHQLMQNISTLIIFDTCINWKKKITGNFVNIKDLITIQKCYYLANHIS